jgi:hypothetical protein
MIRTVERSTDAARSPAVALPALGALVRPAPAPVLRLGRPSGLGTGRAGRAFRSPAVGNLHGRPNGGLRLARLTRCLGASGSRRGWYRSASSSSSRSRSLGKLEKVGWAGIRGRRGDALALGENRSLKGRRSPPRVQGVSFRCRGSRMSRSLPTPARRSSTGSASPVRRRAASPGSRERTPPPSGTARASPRQLSYAFYWTRRERGARSPWTTRPARSTPPGSIDMSAPPRKGYRVSYPVPGTSVISLQGRVPRPAAFDKRLVVRGELVASFGPRRAPCTSP